MHAPQQRENDEGFRGLWRELDQVREARHWSRERLAREVNKLANEELPVKTLHDRMFNGRRVPKGEFLYVVRALGLNERVWGERWDRAEQARRSSPVSGRGAPGEHWSTFEPTDKPKQVARPIPENLPTPPPTHSPSPPPAAPTTSQDEPPAALAEGTSPEVGALVAAGDSEKVALRQHVDAGPPVSLAITGTADEPADPPQTHVNARSAIAAPNKQMDKNRNTAKAALALRGRRLVVATFLAVLALIVGWAVTRVRAPAPPVASPSATYNSISGRTDPPPRGAPFLLRSSNYPDQYLAVEDGRVKLRPVTSIAERNRSALVLDPGLTGQGVSLHLATKPYQYLRQHGFLMWAEAKSSEDPTFDADATFFLVERGLTGEPGISFRWSKDPERFIRHRDGVFHIETQNDYPDTPYQLDATFTWVPA